MRRDNILLTFGDAFCPVSAGAEDEWITYDIQLESVFDAKTKFWLTTPHDRNQCFSMLSSRFKLNSSCPFVPSRVFL
jgi:hypothetical protein